MNKKISQLTAGNGAQVTDNFPIERGGTNRKLTIQEILDLIPYNLPAASQGNLLYFDEQNGWVPLTDFIYNDATGDLEASNGIKLGLAGGASAGTLSFHDDHAYVIDSNGDEKQLDNLPGFGILVVKTATEFEDAFTYIHDNYDGGFVIVADTISLTKNITIDCTGITVLGQNNRFYMATFEIIVTNYSCVFQDTIFENKSAGGAVLATTNRMFLMDGSALVVSSTNFVFRNCIFSYTNPEGNAVEIISLGTYGVPLNSSLILKLYDCSFIKNIGWDYDPIWIGQFSTGGPSYANHVLMNLTKRTHELTSVAIAGYLAGSTNTFTSNGNAYLLTGLTDEYSGASLTYDLDYVTARKLQATSGVDGTPPDPINVGEVTIGFSAGSSKLLVKVKVDGSTIKSGEITLT